MESIFDGYDCVILNYNKDELKRLLPFRDSLNQIGIKCLVAKITVFDDIVKDSVSVFGYFINEPDAARQLSAANIPLSDKYSVCVCGNGEGYVFDNLNFDKNVGYVHTNHDTERVSSLRYFRDNNAADFAKDYYDNTGRRYSRTFSDEKGNVLIQFYYDASGREVIREDYKTGVIALSYNRKKYHFTSRSNFAVWFFKKFGLFDKKFVFSENNHRIRRLLENCSYAVQICSSEKDMLTDSKYHCKYFVFDNICKNLPANSCNLGLLRDFDRENHCSLNCVTHIDAKTVDHFINIVESVPFVRFHVMMEDAETVNCVPKICGLKNIEIYHMDRYMYSEGIMKNKLLDLCDMSVDIDGYMSKFEEAMFFRNILMFSFTGMKSKYICSDHIYKQGETGRFKSFMLLARVSKSVIKSAVEMQQRMIFRSSEKDYKKFADDILKGNV